ncbi:hypothetical protein [Emticicia sp. SJ17W-69]|uniref:hypothetical protein n=1 Tax=Emticicia sp. SJ17W-69 TaxID=3421657 RepID=UPI003EB6F69A
MKKFIALPRILSILLFISIFLLSCKDLKNLDPGKDLKVIMNYKPADSFVEAQVKDAKTGNLITDKINIQIIGKEVANVINFEGEAKTSYTKKGPSIYLGLRNVTPTAAQPIDFKIIISVDGYLTSSRDVSLKGVNNPPVEILLVKASTPPAGSAVQQTTITNSATTGSNQDNSIVVVNGKNATIVDVDKGTVMKDGTGNALSGALQTTVATFSGQSSESAKAFPASNATVLSKGPNGESNVKGTLVPSVFAAVEMKSANGSRVATFSQPVDISFEISPNRINPKTSLKVKVGDTFPIYSYSESTGVWTYEKEGIVISQDNKLFVTFPTSHLSWFALADFIISNSASSFNVKVTFNSDGSVSAASYPCSIEAFYQPSEDGGEPSIQNISTEVKRNADGNSYSLDLEGIGLNVTKLVLKVNFGVGTQVFEVTRSNGSLSNTNFTFKTSTNKKKTIYINVSCENDKPLEIKPYNVGIEGTLLSPVNWSFLGNVSYDSGDNKIKLITSLPDGVDMNFRSVSYPDYTKIINTGTAESFTVPILLTKDHPLCK